MTDKKKGQAMANVSVIGAGSWGTALALLLCKNGHDVTVWSYKEEEVRTLSEKREHVSKLPGVKIPDEIFFTADLKEAVEGKDVVVLAVPSIHVRNTAKKMNAYVKGGQILVDVAKGIEEDTLMTLSQQIEEEIPQADVAVLSGPSHAEEVGRGLPTTVCIGAHTETTAKYLQQLFMNEVFRVYISPDILGIELGGSLKNVIALAAGVADGMGYGDNTKAALDFFRIIPEHNCQCVGASDPYQRMIDRIYRSPLIFFIIIIDQFYCYFRVCLRIECIPFTDKFIL